ncbi:Mpv17/PMP22 family protein [Fervidobacterium pennivorans subsp. shakshaketiis]|uniref:Mpv17 / PMP22 family n=2 Tax=Fervidobacterium pennivorans TaxID=93466 RepID=H9UAX9_FERPD|nr:Mpv17/PMP22 family protein [Fervidobacterium pennivorans]AFG34672.1 Mpv17 / PMP22 family [Fervidobacterium pennivorans DSM 9078]
MKHTIRSAQEKSPRLLFGDTLTILFFVILAILLLNDKTRTIYVNLNSSHPYILGFLKVGILATFGEILSLRISKGKYSTPVGVIYRFIVWGFLGVVFVTVFELFFSGTKALLEKQLLPYTNNARTFFQAFYTSVLMNLIFAPTFMAFHRITDAYIDLGNGNLKKIFTTKFDDVLNAIDWRFFVKFVLGKTIPFFWIPAHTVTFLLPSNYRVLVAALLSVFLGILLSFKKRSVKLAEVK